MVAQTNRIDSISGAVVADRFPTQRGRGWTVPLGRLRLVVALLVEPQARKGVDLPAALGATDGELAALAATGGRVDDPRWDALIRLYRGPVRG